VSGRGKWQGVFTIARFNWPFYAVGIAIMILSLTGFLRLARMDLRVLCGVAFVIAAYFVVVSLAASHLIYDRSDLYRWAWLQQALWGARVRQATFCHCGFDEASSSLRRQFPEVQWQLLDHFDEKQMTEPSIRRARAMFPPCSATQRSPYDAWPVAAGSTNLVLALLAIHELRSEAERSRWFAECRRCLCESGCVVLVEHVRDAANFLAFGPGFLHFHSPASWRRCWESAGFHSINEFRVTPFIRIFVLSTK
jgi:hypothetical protein